MPSLKSLAAADEEKEKLGRRSEAHSFDLNVDVREEDPDEMDDDVYIVERDEVEAQDKEASEEEEEDDDDDEEEDEEEEEEDEEEEDEEEEEEEGSEERSESSSREEQSESEFMSIDLADIRKNVQCPICLGIIRKTRTAMECLHRFCKECIDKSMRLGNNECPTCRKHLASRRSLRDDPNFDAFIAALFKDIDKFEEEELAFREDDEVRNKQIQESIAQVEQKQSEVLLKRKSLGKEVAVVSRSQSIGCGSRRRRNWSNMDEDTSEDHDSSSDEPEILLRKRRKRKRSKTQPSSSKVNNNDNGTEQAHHKESRGISPGLVWNPGIMFSWGRVGKRSEPRVHGAASKRQDRLNRLVEQLQSNNVEMYIHLKLVSVEPNCLPNLHQPYLCFRSTLLVKQLREFVAVQLQLKAEEIELLGSKDSTGKMQSLTDDDTLTNLNVDCISGYGHKIILYQQKQIG